MLFKCHANTSGINVPLAPKFVKGRSEAWRSEGCDVRAAGKESHLYRATVKKGDIMVLQTLMVHQVVVGPFPFNSHLLESATCMSFLTALKKQSKILALGGTR